PSPEGGTALAWPNALNRGAANLDRSHSSKGRLWRIFVNTLKTAMLLAALTAMFMGLGYEFGGADGAIIAFVVAAGMNLFPYWNADKIVLSLHRARQVDAGSAPEFYRIVADLAGRAG